MHIESLQDLYLKEVRDLYGGAKLIVKTLPKMMDRAELPELRQLLANHLTETQSDISQLERILQNHGEKPAGKNGKALPGILREAEDDVDEVSNPSLRDAAIAAAAQQIAHYEIAAYGTLHAYSIHLGHRNDSEILQKALDEERRQDQQLTEIALNKLKVAVTRTA